MNTGDKIRALRKEHTVSRKDLANALGVTPSAIGNWEIGFREPTLEHLKRMCQIFNVPMSFFSDDPVQPKNLLLIKDMHHRSIPVIGAVACGQPKLAEQQHDLYVDSPIEADYALRCDGDSMSPTYLDGDVVFVRACPDVSDGQIAVVLIDDTATLKHVYRQSDGLLLTGDNPLFAPILVKFSEHDYLAILGVPVGFTRIYR